MTVPVRNPQVNPYAYGIEGALQTMCAYIAAGLPTQDEYGASITVYARANYSSETFSEPLILVSIPEFSDGLFEPGLNQMGVSLFDTTQMVRGHKMRVTMRFEVLGRNDPERHYLLDYVLGIIPAGYAVTSGGAVVEAAIIQGMAGIGVVCEGWTGGSIPPVDLTAPRPLGQPYTAFANHRCLLWRGWETPIPTIPSAQFQNQATGADGSTTGFPQGPLQTVHTS